MTQTQPNDELSGKAERLLQTLHAYESAAVGFSGGVDSTLLALAAHKTLGEKAIAFLSVSPSQPRRDVELAHTLAERIGIELVTVDTNELADPYYRANGPDRCYWCKLVIFKKIRAHPRARRLAVVCDGANLDDADDWRPGAKAAKELGVAHPLQEAGFTKQDVRDLARCWNLPNWDKPSGACLATRIAYGQEITAERLERVGLAEEFLQDAGCRTVRVRDHGDDLARIETPIEDIDRLIASDRRDAVLTRLRELGFRFVCIDLEGFRSGSMNRLLT